MQRFQDDLNDIRNAWVLDERFRVEIIEDVHRREAASEKGWSDRLSDLIVR